MTAPKSLSQWGKVCACNRPVPRGPLKKVLLVRERKFSVLFERLNGLPTSRFLFRIIFFSRVIMLRGRVVQGAIGYQGSCFSHALLSRPGEHSHWIK